MKRHQGEKGKQVDKKEMGEDEGLTSANLVEAAAGG
jgi:hypothetical protein